MMKRCLTLFLCICLVLLVVLSGCGSKSSSTEGTETTETVSTAENDTESDGASETNELATETLISADSLELPSVASPTETLESVDAADADETIVEETTAEETTDETAETTVETEDSTGYFQSAIQYVDTGTAAVPSDTSDYKINFSTVSSSEDKSFSDQNGDWQYLGGGIVILTQGHVFYTDLAETGDLTIPLSSVIAEYQNLENGWLIVSYESDGTTKYAYTLPNGTENYDK